MSLIRISKGVEYGILAAGYVARVEGDRPLVTSQEIAARYEISMEYLLKVMKDLAKAGILKSKRGPRGGFCLAKPAGKITLLEIISALDGPMEGFVSTILDDSYQVNVAAVRTRAMIQARTVLAKATVASLLKEG